MNPKLGTNQEADQVNLNWNNDRHKETHANGIKYFACPRIQIFEE